jgi:hypothetical protein
VLTKLSTRACTHPKTDTILRRNRRSRSHAIRILCIRRRTRGIRSRRFCIRGRTRGIHRRICRIRRSG